MLPTQPTDALDVLLSTSLEATAVGVPLSLSDTASLIRTLITRLRRQGDRLYSDITLSLDDGFDSALQYTELAAFDTAHLITILTASLFVLDRITSSSRIDIALACHSSSLEVKLTTRLNEMPPILGRLRSTDELASHFKVGTRAFELIGKAVCDNGVFFDAELDRSASTVTLRYARLAELSPIPEFKNAEAIRRALELSERILCALTDELRAEQEHREHQRGLVSAVASDDGKDERDK